MPRPSGIATIAMISSAHPFAHPIPQPLMTNSPPPLTPSSPALPRDRVRDELEDDPEEGPDDRADEQARRESVLPRRREMHRARDEHDRERVRNRPDHEREVPQEVALREIDVALDDAAEADQLAPQRRGYCGHPNTSLISPSTSPSCSKTRPVAAKNASSSVCTP